MDPFSIATRVDFPVVLACHVFRTAKIEASVCINLTVLLFSRKWFITYLNFAVLCVADGDVEDVQQLDKSDGPCAPPKKRKYR